jgi:hypothetical protein
MRVKVLYVTRMRKRRILARACGLKPYAAATACTIYAVPHTTIDVHRSYVPFWLHGVVGADLRPDTLTTLDLGSYLSSYLSVHSNPHYHVGCECTGLQACAQQDCICTLSYDR